MKIERVVLLIVISLIVGFGIWFLRENTACLTILSTVFVAGIGGFLGLDILKMIKETKILPAGDYEPMKKWKYYLSSGLFLLEIGNCIWIEYYYQIKVSIATGLFMSGVGIVLSIMMNGLQANSVVTGTKEK